MLRAVANRPLRPFSCQCQYPQPRLGVDL